jgi:hypothetical protein
MAPDVHKPDIFAQHLFPGQIWEGPDMAKIESAGLKEVVREPKPGFFRRIGGPQFFVAQIFTMLATVFGVYLAAYVGFQRTLEYDRFTKAQQRSDLITATREELKQNVARLHKLNERLPADVGTGVTEWPRLRLFVWQAVGRSSSAFDVPPQILTDLQALYEDLGDMLTDAEARQSFRSLSGSNVYFRGQYKERLSAELRLAETSIIPALDRTAAEAEKLVERYADPARASK